MFSVSGPRVFIGVVVKVGDEATLKRYLYAGVKETQVFDTYMPDKKLHMLEAESETRAQNQADRLSSGMMGARACTAHEAVEMIKEYAPDPK
jgi:hypothetical protein